MLKRVRLGEDMWFGWNGVLKVAAEANSSKSRCMAESKSMSFRTLRRKGDGVSRRGCCLHGGVATRWAGEKAG